MSPLRPVWILLAATLVLVTTTVEAVPFRAQDYAYSAAIQTTGPGPIYAASLPLAVYQSVTQPDLRDLCVVNAALEVVPFAIRRPKPSRAESPAPVTLNLFPIHGSTNSVGAALRLRLRAGETALDIDRPAQGTTPNRPTSYLVDARAIKSPIAEVRVGWDPTTPAFAAALSIDASDDLEHWRRVSSGAQLVNLRYAGEEFVRNSIPLAATRTAFLRLTWSEVGTAPLITQISVLPPSVNTPPTKLSYSVTGTLSAQDDDFEYEFNLGARLPVEEVNLRLPERNSVVSAEFLVPTTESSHWRRVANGEVYDLSVPGANDLTNPPISVAPTDSQHWKVRIGKAGGGVGHGAPDLEVSWTPSEVVFLARGSGPYRLLYGNASANSLALEPSSILRPASEADNRDQSLQADHATFLAPAILGGTARLTPVAPPPHWERWILWAVLVVGVTALGTMAWKLSKSMG